MKDLCAMIIKILFYTVKHVQFYSLTKHDDWFLIPSLDLSYSPLFFLFIFLIADKFQIRDMSDSLFSHPCNLLFHSLLFLRELVCVCVFSKNIYQNSLSLSISLSLSHSLYPSYKYINRRTYNPRHVFQKCNQTHIPLKCQPREWGEIFSRYQLFHIHAFEATYIHNRHIYTQFHNRENRKLKMGNYLHVSGLENGFFFFYFVSLCYPKRRTNNSCKISPYVYPFLSPHTPLLCFPLCAFSFHTIFAFESCKHQQQQERVESEKKDDKKKYFKIICAIWFDDVSATIWW